MAANHKLSSKDKKDLDKFTKYLVYKCIQIIVQSRLGERVKTQSRPYSTGADWFNLVIKDLPEVLIETKKNVATGAFVSDQHICVEISLKTTEGESMILETWNLSMTDQKDPYARVFYTVYNRMSLMLKSLFCVTRATPAYRLSRRQGSDSYVMCYRIYNTTPETNLLGPGYLTKTVGKVPTPVGTINLTVQYRTKMLISPYTSKELVENLKDDHFNVEASPNRCHAIPRPCFYTKENRASTTEDGFALGESEFSASSFGTSPLDQCIYHIHDPAASPYVKQSFTHPSQGGFEHLNGGSQSNGHNGPNAKVVKPNNQSNGLNGFHSKENGISKENGGKISLEKIGGFVSDGESEDEVDGPGKQGESTELPFVQLVKQMSNVHIDNNANKMHPVQNGNHLQHQQQNGHDQHGTCIDGRYSKVNGMGSGHVNGDATKAKLNSCEQASNRSSERLRHVSGESTNSGSSRASAADDYVLIDMKCALTEIDDNPELGRFYRDCKDAPDDLTMFHNEAHVFNTLPVMNPEVREATTATHTAVDHMFMNSITDQLLQFEAQGHDFDDFVNSLSTAEA